MSRLLGAVVLASLVKIVPVEAADLALQRVMLSSGSVGYFEYETAVDGNEALSLDVPLDQVDDILKSLVSTTTAARPARSRCAAASR